MRRENPGIDDGELPILELEARPVRPAPPADRWPGLEVARPALGRPGLGRPGLGRPGLGRPELGRPGLAPRGRVPAAGHDLDGPLDAVAERFPDPGPGRRSQGIARPAEDEIPGPWWQAFVLWAAAFAGGLAAVMAMLYLSFAP